MIRVRVTRAPMVFGAIVLVITGCTNEKIVYRDTPLLNQPTAAAGFLGYSDNTTGKTVCGNCHAEAQAEWKQTAHAGAWKTLDANAGKQAFCQACHTVNNLGNAATDTAVGWRSTKDVRYHDVQCESCHGAGLQHVSNPTSQNIPLASIATDSTRTNGCGECHNGSHHPFVNEWQQSRHFAVQPSVRTNADAASCVACHSAQGALKAWGVTANYVEKNLPVAQQQGITCIVCHDPHNATNPKQLRFRIDVGSEEENLCMKCHRRRARADEVTTRNSPHSPEGPTLLGSAGWWPPNLKIAGDSIIATHGTARNPRLCATCHVDRFQVTDKTTNALVFQVTGHKFKAIPCLSAQGIPTAADTCAEAQRTYRGCTASGCHGSENAARSARSVAETRIANLTVEADRLISLVPKAELDLKDGRYSTAEGTQFNSALAKTRGAVVHNPFLIEALLTGSIAQMKKDYGLTVSAGIELQNILPRQ